MNTKSLLSGFVSEVDGGSSPRPGSTWSVADDPEYRFYGRAMDEDDALELQRKGEEGISLRLKSMPGLNSKLGKRFVFESELGYDESVDFRDLIILDPRHSDDSKMPCPCGASYRQLCLCKALGINDPEHELCLGIFHVDDYEMMDLKTKRSSRAFSETGRLLSAEFCTVFVRRQEVVELIAEGHMKHSNFVGRV